MLRRRVVVCTARTFARAWLWRVVGSASIAAIVLLCVSLEPPRASAFHVLVFSKTSGFRHSEQIAAGQQALTRLASERGFTVDFSESENVFTARNLEQYDAVLFLFTSGDILGPAAESAFEGFIAAGGGFAGVHSTTDTEYEWAFYGNLVGAYFAGHPAVQTATVVVVDGSHPSTAHLPPTFEHSDEWYNFDVDPSEDPDVRVLLEVDESTYSGGTMGASHPIAWTKQSGASRAWYTAMGHTLLEDSDYEGFFGEHLYGGLEFAALPEPGLELSGWAAILAIAALRRRGDRSAGPSLSRPTSTRLG